MLLELCAIYLSMIARPIDHIYRINQTAQRRCSCIESSHKYLVTLYLVESPYLSLVSRETDFINLVTSMRCLSSPWPKNAPRRFLRLDHYTSHTKAFLQRMQISQWRSKRSTIKLTRSERAIDKQFKLPPVR